MKEIDMIYKIILMLMCIFMNHTHCFSFTNLFKTDTDPALNKTVEILKVNATTDKAIDQEAENFINIIKNSTNLTTPKFVPGDFKVVTTTVAPKNETRLVTNNTSLTLVTAKPPVMNKLNESGNSTNNSSSDQEKILPSPKENPSDNPQNETITLKTPSQSNATDLIQNQTSLTNTPIHNVNLTSELSPTNSSLSQNSTVNTVPKQIMYQTAYTTIGNNDAGKELCSQQCSSTNCVPGCPIHCCISEVKQKSSSSHFLLSQDENFTSALQMGASDLEKSFLDTISQLTMKVSDTQPLQFSEMISQPQSYYDYLYSPSNTAYGQLFGGNADKKSDVIQQSQYEGLYAPSNINKKRRTYKRSRVPNAKVKIYSPNGFNSNSESRKYIDTDSWAHYSKNQYL